MLIDQNGLLIRIIPESIYTSYFRDEDVRLSMRQFESHIISISLLSLKLSVYYVIDKDMACAYNTKNLYLLIGQILINNVGR